MGIGSRLLWLGAASVVGVITAVACGNGAVGVQACRQIETARCEAAPACPAYFTLSSQPVPAGDPVAACVRYYNDECLHGMTTNVDPSTVQVNGCVAWINATGKAAASERDSGADCYALAHPETSSACSFINYDAGAPATPDTGSEDAGSTNEDAGD